VIAMRPLKVKCGECEKGFVRTHHRQKFCGVSCRLKAQARAAKDRAALVQPPTPPKEAAPAPLRECRGCAELFRPQRNQKYCSVCASTKKESNGKMRATTEKFLRLLKAEAEAAKELACDAG